MKNKQDYPMKPIFDIMNNAINKLSEELLSIEYKDYIIVRNDYPHSEYKYIYYHKDETDGNFNMCRTVDECKEEIDLIHEENNF